MVAMNADSAAPKLTTPSPAGGALAPSSSSSSSSSPPASSRGSGGDGRTDEQLFAAYKAGDAAAFRKLVERHHAPVYRFCLRALRSPEAAADAAQEVFLRVVKNCASWEPKAKFTTWLYTVARNHCIDEARKGKFRKTESLNEAGGKDGEGADKIENVPSTTPQQDSIANDRRLRTAIDAELSPLPDEQREVFLMREVSEIGSASCRESV